MTQPRGRRDSHDVISSQDLAASRSMVSEVVLSVRIGAAPCHELIITAIRESNADRVQHHSTRRETRALSVPHISPTAPVGEASGRRTTNVLPVPSSLSTEMVPP